MRALFRVDSGLGIGGGHLFRCLVLADELARRGWRCAFACRPHEGALSAEVAARGHELRQLAAPCAQAAAAEARHEAWIGADLEQDAAETRALVSDFRPDWLVADHYGLDARWEASARAGTSSALLVVDDLADRPHACDVLLDQNLWPDAERRYDGLLPEDCRTLLGPRFALLRGRDRTQEDVDPPSRVVLAFFGAEDPTGECSKLAAAWQARYGGEQASALELRIIAGRLNRDLARLEALAGRMEGAVRADLGSGSGDRARARALRHRRRRRLDLGEAGHGLRVVDRGSRRESARPRGASHRTRHRAPRRFGRRDHGGGLSTVPPPDRGFRAPRRTSCLPPVDL